MDYNLPQISGIDWETAHRYIPEKDVLITVLQEFVGSAKKQTALLKEYRQKVLEHPDPENFASYRIQAHAMKAALRSLGSDLFDSAYALETAGKEENLPVIERDTDSFTEAFLQLSDRFRIITGDCDRGAAYDEETFFMLVDRTEDAMQSFDIPALQEAFEAIQAMQIPAQYEGIVRGMEPAVRDLESDTVTECCARLRKLKKG